MQFPVKRGAPVNQKTACAILPLFDGRPLQGATLQFDTATGGQIAQFVKSGNAAGTLGRTAFVHDLNATDAACALLVGCGKRGEFGAKQLRSALAAAADALGNTGIRNAIAYFAHESVAGVDAYYAARVSVETFRAKLYRFDELKSKPEPRPGFSRLGLSAPDRDAAHELRRGAADGAAIAAGVDLARDLGNRPANICTPAHLSSVAREIANDYENFEIEVVDELEMQRLGMGALLSVTHGAEEPAQLIVLNYRGDPNGAQPVALCGKGITFDTGGISIKPAAKLDEMKYDMCGAAGVLGTMKALGELKAPINVVAVVPACENMPGSRATRPGDIVRSMSGQTIEILNTDAEGRLILADALTYAKRFEPRYVIDIATLTGACVVALGKLYTGLFTNDDDLSEQLLDAGRRSLDPAWRMPADAEYGESMKSNFADFANLGARYAGASSAAHFLSRFADPEGWAHLDIAGTAWLADAAKGATGRPVPLLVDFLLHLRDR